MAKGRGMTLSIIFGTLGFIMAAYAVIANDSAQTLGTFIASNKENIMRIFSSQDFYF